MTKKARKKGHIYDYNSTLTQKRGLKSHIDRFHVKKDPTMYDLLLVLFMHNRLSFRDESNNKFGYLLRG